MTSFILQCVIGTFLAHQFDMGVFFAAGYLVARGMSPYTFFPASSVFNGPGFYTILPGIGYPPPWPLFLGLMYALVYEPTRNMFAYNLAIKLPSIISNIALALVLEKTALQQGLTKKRSSGMFYFILFNPFMIYIAAAWGQLDSVVILASVLSINELYKGHVNRSAVLLALSVALKVIPLVLAPVFILFIKRNFNFRRNVEFVLMGYVALVAFVWLPFNVFKWDVNVILGSVGSRLVEAGGFTLFNLLELREATVSLPPTLWLLGYVWILALTLVYYRLLKTGLKTKMDLFRWASAVIFVFMLTRTWVSEQNIVLLIPLVVLLWVVSGESWALPHLLWIFPLIYTILNTSPLQMFLLVYPEPVHAIIAVVEQLNVPRLILKFLIVIPWQIVGWSYVRHVTMASRSISG